MKITLMMIAKALRQAHGKEAADEYTSAAFKCKSYDELLRLTLDTVEVE